VALWLGLAAAGIALTMGMGQIERGANRIYGIQRDRPTTRKYARAFAMAVTAGLSGMLGFLVLVAGGELSRAVAAVYGIDAALVQVLRWPLGVVLVMIAYTVIFAKAPRRSQPGYSWLAFGAGVALVLWLAFTSLLVLYVQSSGSFGSTYGPLTGFMALLIWANLTSVALFLGIAFAAQLEAVRASVRTGAGPDPERYPPSSVDYPTAAVSVGATDT
jgi:YihY family inner membrane protein